MSINSTNQKSPLVIPIILILVAAFLGYGLGRWQTGLRVEVLTDQLETSESTALNATKGIEAINKRVGILEARRQLDLADKAAEQNDQATAQAILTQAGALMEANAVGSVQEMGKKAQTTTLSGSVAQQRKIIEEFAQSIDANVITPSKIGGGTGQ